MRRSLIAYGRCSREIYLFPSESSHMYSKLIRLTMVASLQSPGVLMEVMRGGRYPVNFEFSAKDEARHRKHIHYHRNPGKTMYIPFRVQGCVEQVCGGWRREKPLAEHTNQQDYTPLGAFATHAIKLDGPTLKLMTMEPKDTPV